ncbi:C4-dicarboxylate ABC transporter substrate-binding protein [Parafrankia soli]|uniref:C4-dicarboxylate ABC transporter substrate-binding protein n=1 Tax=Parafrankia soli TaxID=2599596 RepID=A0A1S1PZ54_9ACTN|nr:TAXI family TRAP transporter solute-binding subunit [Parafrankia soli]OHV27953.1 C4-dicarboxylate ABC transporter substrate-binding protein [Parafrankia soli]
MPTESRLGRSGHGQSGATLTTLQRATVVGLVALSAAVAVGLGLTARDDPPGTAWPPGRQATSCHDVKIFTGQVGSPYNRFARVLRTRLQAAPEHWDVEVVPTGGSAENIYHLEEQQYRTCSLALAQLGTTVDAGSAVNQFSPQRGGHLVEGLRTLGPAHDDLLHVIVRAPGSSPPGTGADVRTFTDLCDRAIAAGPAASGTRQIGTVLLRVGLPGTCAPRLEDSSIDDGLRLLVAGAVDAVFWAGGAGTERIRTELANGVKLQVLDLAQFRDAIAADWEKVYHPPGRYFPGTVFPPGHLGPRDYPGMTDVDTVSLPNGVLAHEQADPALVRRATADLFGDPAEYERALWGDNPAGRRVPDALTVYESPLFCYVPLHPAAAEYYRLRFDRGPGCGR